MIDTQHRMMVLLCRRLDIAIKTRQPEQRIKWIMLELKKFTEFHFLSEENLMHEDDYPEVAEHAHIHTELLMQLEMILAKISHHKEFPEDLLYFLNKWLIQHVTLEDLKISKHIEISGKQPIGESLYGEMMLENRQVQVE